MKAFEIRQSEKRTEDQGEDRKASGLREKGGLPRMLGGKIRFPLTIKEAGDCAECKNCQRIGIAVAPIVLETDKHRSKPDGIDDCRAQQSQFAPRVEAPHGHGQSKGERNYRSPLC